MTRNWFCCFLVAVCMLPSFARSQTARPSSDKPTACPIEILSFKPSGWVNVHIRNVSGKKVVGLVCNAAIADATEHWKWLHYDFDDNRPLQEFNWNKEIKAGAKKSLEWQTERLDLERGGGVAFVLTSVLFSDGSLWQEPIDSASCKSIWYKNKKSAFRPIQLPPRTK